MPKDAIVELSRLAARLQPDARDAFAERLEALVADLVAADDPDGEPYGFLFGMHRRARVALGVGCPRWSSDSSARRASA